MKKTLLRTTVMILGVVAGAGIGAYVSFARYSRDYPLARAFAWTQLTFAVTQNQFDSHSSDARKGLSFELSLFQKFAESPSLDQATKDAIQMNVGRLEAQLSMLESEAGNANQAVEYMAKAQENLRAIGWINYSKDEVLRVFDRQPLQPCAATSQSAASGGTVATRNPCG